MEKNNEALLDKRKIDVKNLSAVREMVEYSIRNTVYKINAMWADTITFSSKTNYNHTWKTLSMNDIVYDLLPNSLGVDYILLDLSSIDDTIIKLYKAYKELTVQEETEEDVPGDNFYSDLYATNIDNISNYD